MYIWFKFGVIDHISYIACSCDMFYLREMDFGASPLCQCYVVYYPLSQILSFVFKWNLLQLVQRNSIMQWSIENALKHECSRQRNSIYKYKNLKAFLIERLAFLFCVFHFNLSSFLFRCIKILYFLLHQAVQLFVVFNTAYEY